MSRTMLVLFGSSLLLTGQANRLGQDFVRPPNVHPPKLPVQTSGCPTDEAVAPSAELIGPNDFVEVQRTQCFGPCPMYKVRIGGDGQIAWRGEAYVQLKGSTSARVSPDDALLVIGKFQKAGFWSLCESYDRPITDVPSTITTVHIGDNEKHVSDRADSAPDWLRELDLEVDALSDTHRWIHGDPQNETFGSLAVDSRGSKPGVTPLMRAAGRGDLAEVQRQLATNADPNAQDSSGWTALIYATLTPTPEIMKALLDAGADPRVASHTGQTAIMAASGLWSSAEKEIRLLIGAGGDINAQDKDGQTALMTVVVPGFERAGLVSFMLGAGARTDLRDTRGFSALDHLEQAAKRRPAEDRSDYEKLRQLLYR